MGIIANDSYLYFGRKTSLTFNFPMKNQSVVSVILVLTGLPVVAPWADEAARTDASGLEEIIVIASGSQFELTDEFAGGQVARGGRAGFLGNLDRMDAPFSGTAYTESLIRNQQADSVGDVLQNDPVVRVAKGFGNFQELYMVRGFPVFSDDMTYNGIYGILPRQYVAAEFVERVEVFRGANSFLNGAAPGGSGVGGAFNLVPKRAPDTPLTRATLGVEGGSEFYGAFDIGRRFGDDDALGVRANLVRRDGESAIDDQKRELSAFALGGDYRGERLRVALDFGYQDHGIDAPRPQVTPIGPAARPPEASGNFAQPWTCTEEEQLFGVLRGEYDLTDRVTAWLAAGARQGEESNVLANPSATSDGTTSSYRFDNAREDDILSADAGVRVEFFTGSVGHRLIASVSLIDLESRNAYAFSDFSGFPGSLYSPVAVAPPAADFFTGGDLGNPLRTEAVRNTSVAVADMLSLLNGQLLATLGLRWQDIETRSFDYNTGSETSRYAESAVTPAVGLVYRLSERISLYGNYAESLQPGAIAPETSGGSPILNAGEVLDPFRGEQFELGAKYDGGDVGGSLALFQLDKPYAIVENQVFTNSGEQRNRGVELSVYGQLQEGLRLIGGATVLDAELARTQGGIDQGNAALGVPDLQANLKFEWDVGALPGLTLDARVVYTDGQYLDSGNAWSIPSWTRFDAGARYTGTVAGRPYTLRARVENLADSADWVSVGGYPGANYLVLGTPRTFVLSASVDF
jgi:iron complex outermembrane receptor protein